MNILFWNTHENPNINACLGGLILERRCDIIVLAEYAGDLARLCDEIYLRSRIAYDPIQNLGGCKRIKSLARAEYNIESLRERDRYQIAVISTSLFKLVLAMIHNRSRLHADVWEQKNVLDRLHRDIAEVEDCYGTRNTVVLGDFNMSPFEEGFVATDSMHSIPFMEELGNKERVFSGQAYRKFYNPMWKFMSARTVPYATYYYSSSSLIEYYWHMYDQVLLRPQLMKAFDGDSLAIVTKAGRHELMKNGKPDKTNYSDHLPVFFKLREEQIYD